MSRQATKYNASFSGQWRFLSNFWNFERPLKHNCTIDGERVTLLFKTSEAFYMAMKTEDLKIRRLICTASSGAEAKKIGAALELRDDWEEIKEAVMTHALHYKFSKNNPTLRKQLLATKDSYLQEANWWNDKYWGVCMKTGEGKNRLGVLLMQVRDDILDEIFIEEDLL